MGVDPSVAVIGAGPAGLMAAEVLLENGVAVDIFEAKPTIGRKLLMAGKSGLNITHTENFELFLSRFSAPYNTLENSIKNFTPTMLQQWTSNLGIETFEGSSKRVFPREMKASPLLRKWHARLSRQFLKTHLNYKWLGWNDNGSLLFSCPSGIYEHTPIATILALGGMSWPRLGSDGNWLNLFKKNGITVREFFPTNCGFHFDWSNIFRERFSGSPIKSCKVTVDEKPKIETQKEVAELRNYFNAVRVCQALEEANITSLAPEDRTIKLKLVIKEKVKIPYKVKKELVNFETDDLVSLGKYLHFRINALMYQHVFAYICAHMHA